MRILIVLCLIFCADLLFAQPLPLSQSNLATYASVTPVVHVVRYKVGQNAGYAFCNMLRIALYHGDSLDWPNEMSIAFLRSLILKEHDLDFIPYDPLGFNWSLNDDEICSRLFSWSDKKLLRKWQRMQAYRNTNRALWLSYLLALWNRGYMVKVSSETGDLYLEDPVFAPYRNFPEIRL
jgi:hypothetical protein